MVLHALGTKILVKMDKRQEQSGRFFIPEVFVNRRVIGTITSVGDYVESVDVNDRVLLRQNCGVELIIDDDEYTLIEEDLVLGRIEDEPEDSI